MMCIDDTVSKLQAGNSALTPLITTVETALKDTGVVDMVQSGLDHFFDGMPVFMNAVGRSRYRTLENI